MPSLTKAEAAALGRKRQQPVKAPGELLAVFVSGKLVNGKNASRGWQMKAWGRYKREWKERVALALLESKALGPMPVARVRKRITFKAFQANEMDSDGLALAIAPIRDALVGCGVISGDADRDGHTFTYEQVIDRANRGVEIRVRLL